MSENNKLSRDSVRWGYRLFLNREAESEEAIAYKCQNLLNYQELRQEFL
ncbi:hypothetical protein A5482_010835 [Cyanobacterium sp. IPPAS B-1200]|nr:hypothetical protein [Cyanobacterium sp. IPPAS B-1200]